jgi:hypothetical protein
MQTFAHQVKPSQSSARVNRAGNDSNGGIHTDPGKSSYRASVAQTAQFDFGRIPILTNIPMSQPGDELEQEAERVAAAVMGGSPDAVVATAASSGPDVQRCACDDCACATGAPAIVYDALRSPSQPLDTAARRFMEGRFGHDFRHVRIHANAEAAQAARSVDAQAYTVGSQVVFGAGEYQPNSPRGRQLIAHELTHVLQQRNGDPVVRRRILYPNPVKTRNMDLIQTFLSHDGPTLAVTVLTVNGTVVANGQAILDALTPAEIKSPHPATAPAGGSGAGSGSGSGASIGSGSGGGSGSGAGPGSALGGSGTTQQCGFRNFDVSISGKISMPAAPQDGKWSEQLERRAIGRTDLPRQCSGKDHINVVMKGKPDSGGFYQWMEGNEDEHARDFKNASEQFLKPYHEAALAIRGTGANQSACEADRDQQFQRLSTTPIGSFLNQQAADVQCHDSPGRPSAQCPFPAGHGVLHTYTQRNDCDNLEIMMDRTPPPSRP